MSVLATPASTAIPHHELWKQPRLKDPLPVLAAGGDSSIGFGKQWVLSNPIALPHARSEADAAAAASSTGLLMVVLRQPGGEAGAGSNLVVGQAQFGHLFQTGGGGHAWTVDNVQPQLAQHDFSLMSDLRNLHFAPNVVAFTQGDAMLLPTIKHGTVDAAAETDVVKDLRHLGNDLYAGAPLPVASLTQALESATLLSQQAGQAFAVMATSRNDFGEDAGYVIAPLQHLESTSRSTRSPIPQFSYALEAARLDPTTLAWHRSMDSSIRAIVDGEDLAVPTNPDAAVGAARLLPVTRP